MRKKSWFEIGMLVFILMAAVLSCRTPFLSTSEPATSTSVNIELAAGQTIAAQQFFATQTAQAQGVDLTQTAQSAQAATTTANAQFLFATQASLIRESTENANAAQATAAAQIATATYQSLMGTVSANNALATAFSQAQTATALAVVPPELPPLPPSAGVSGTRISFASGATSANVTGEIKKNQTLDYLVRAGKGQTLLLNVYSPNDNVFLGVAGVSTGSVLLRSTSGKTNFTGVLPATQDYRLSLVAPSQKTTFTLQVIIPVRIQFDPGAISAVLDGYLHNRDTNFYLAQARKNQTMTVSVNSPHADIFLTIYGMEDGSPLVRYVSGQTSWTGVLPRTQDYMIEAVSTGGNASYTLKVVIQ